MRPKGPGQRGPIDHPGRDGIIGAANEYFRQFGYDKTTVGDLAKAVGFSAAHIYRFSIRSRRLGTQSAPSASTGSHRPATTSPPPMGLRSSAFSLLLKHLHRTPATCAGEFERATPIDETCRAILMVLEPFRNPALWCHRFSELDDQAAALTALVLRSLRLNLHVTT